MAFIQFDYNYSIFLYSPRLTLVSMNIDEAIIEMQ